MRLRGTDHARRPSRRRIRVVSNCAAVSNPVRRERCHSRHHPSLSSGATKPTCGPSRNAGDGTPSLAFTSVLKRTNVVVGCRICHASSSLLICTPPGSLPAQCPILQCLWASSEDSMESTHLPCYCRGGSSRKDGQDHSRTIKDDDSAGMKRMGSTTNQTTVAGIHVLYMPACGEICCV